MHKVYSYYRKIIFIGLAALAGCNSGGKKGRDHGNGQGGAYEKAERVQQAYYKYLQGSLGGRQVTLQLIKSQGHYEGVFYYDSVARPLTISGDADSSGRLMLVTYRQYAAVDTFRGSFPQPGVFEGYWNSEDSKERTAFTLQEIYPSGTRSWQVYSLQDSLRLRPEDSASQQARIQYTLLWPGKDWSAAGETLVEQTILHTLLGIDTIVPSPAAALQSMADTFFTAYRNLKTDMPAALRETSATLNWESDMRMELLWNAGDIVSLASNRYEYTGGAHGLGTTRLAVWDLQAGKKLELEDIFRPGYEAVLRQALEGELRRVYDIPAGTALNNQRKGGILFEKRLALTHNFYLTGKGIGFIYNPYEVAPYAVGPIELFIPFNKLRAVLKFEVGDQ